MDPFEVKIWVFWINLEFWDKCENEKEALLIYLRSDYNGAVFEKKSEMAGEAETTGEPISRRNIKLGSTFVGERHKIENGVLKRKSVERFAISHSSKVCNGDAVWSCTQRYPAKFVAYFAGAENFCVNRNQTG